MFFAPPPVSGMWVLLQLRELLQTPKTPASVVRAIKIGRILSHAKEFISRKSM